nr:hypothetical protein CFP56_00576 [Quercus suber]
MSNQVDRDGSFASLREVRTSLGTMVFPVCAGAVGFFSSFYSYRGYVYTYMRYMFVYRRNGDCEAKFAVGTGIGHPTLHVPANVCEVKRIFGG